MKAAAASGELQMVECLQGPGDTVYVPAGWHHAVLNLELSCAISQNFITPPMLQSAWPSLGANYHTFAVVLRDMLRHCRPSLAEALPSVADTSPTAEQPQVHVPLRWQAVDPIAAALQDDGMTGTPKAVLFVSQAWLNSWIGRRPSPAAVLALGTAAGLYAYHEHLGHLAWVVRQRESALCILQDVSAGRSDARQQAAQEALANVRVALEDQGLRVAEVVYPGDEAGWASAIGAHTYAVLHEDIRTRHVSLAMSSVPSVGCRVEARVSASSGVGLYAILDCAAGE